MFLITKSSLHSKACGARDAAAGSALPAKRAFRGVDHFGQTRGREGEHRDRTSIGLTLPSKLCILNMSQAARHI